MRQRRSISLVFASLVTAVVFALTGAPAQAAVLPQAALPSVIPGTASWTGTRDYWELFTSHTSGWTPADATLTYQWLSNGKPIPDATGSTFTITNDYMTKNITVKITGSAPGYKSASVTSTPEKASNGAVCTIMGQYWNDTITGTAGNDVICAGASNDIIDGAGGNDVIDGGEGMDVVTYASVKVPVTVNLATHRASSAKSGAAKIFNTENVIGGTSNDSITGDSAANILNGGAGNDRIFGGEGGDRLIGAAGNDTLLGEGGDDSLSGGEGVDSLNGGAGTNLCSRNSAYADSSTNCTMNLAVPTLQWVSAEQNLSGAVTAQIFDPMQDLTQVRVSIAGQVVSLTSFYLDINTTSWSGTVEVPRASVSGRRPLVITTLTGDSRSESWVGSTTESSYKLNSDSTTLTGVGVSSVNFSWDITAPVITGVALSSATVSTAAQEQVIDLTITTTDADPNIYYYCNIKSLDYPNYYFVGYHSASSESVSCSVALPQGAPAGDYGISIDASDSSGNASRIEAVDATHYIDESDATHSIGAGISLIVNENDANIINLPDIGAVSFSSSTVSTKSAAKRVTASFARSGINAQDQTVYCSLVNPGDSSWGVDATATLGVDNIWRAVFTLPKGAAKGKYFLSCTVSDSSGWSVTYKGGESNVFSVSGRNTSSVNDAGTRSFVTNS